MSRDLFDLADLAEDFRCFDGRIGAERIVPSGDDALPLDSHDAVRGKSASGGRQNYVAAPQFRDRTRNDVHVLAAADDPVHAFALDAKSRAVPVGQQRAQRRFELLHAGLRMQSITLRSGRKRSAPTGTSLTMRSRHSSVNASASAS